MRRSLVYPLVRNWNLSIAVLKDTIYVFSLGKKFLQAYYQGGILVDTSLMALNK